ncbi:phage head-to-tail connecting protein [Weissella oryzae SG25]|uniref:Phage head-to-tail connecting protein n=1 Tax=Weissella oryzae (strain DSM 25784 / JCM 18191 / LMG 30913 / SG25) TaxID=1329250 RepID=A0A069CXA8_WEIOS|nr:minor capsid protein [Weissella oryzae]GAK32007.1 phage head-to-tail connecting protein [Weissella oryzae SG25]
MANNYWTKRVDNIFNVLDTQEAELVPKLLTYYQSALDEINNKLFIFYDMYAKEHKLSYDEAIKRVRNTELNDYVERANEYRKSLEKDSEALRRLNAQYVSSQMNRLELLRLEIQFEMIQATDKQDSDLTEYLKHESKYVYDALLAGQAIGNISTDEIETILSMEWSGANYSTRLWRSADAMVNALVDELTRAAINGTNPRVTARRLRDVIKSDKYITERLVRTESTYVANSSIAKRYRDMGVERYEFEATIDNRTSSICKELNGNEYKLSNFQPGTNAPAMHPNCRSRIVPADSELTKYNKYLDDDTVDDLPKWNKKPNV